MVESLHVDDGLWAVLEPLLPERVPRRIGRPRVDERIAFRAILFVLVTGVPWRVLPRRLAARASRRGGGCATGRRPAFGSPASGVAQAAQHPRAARLVGRGGGRQPYPRSSRG